MDSLSAYPCCSKATANGPSPAAAMHQTAKQHDAHLSHHHHQSLGGHHHQHHPLHHQNPANNPVVFYVPNQQQNGASHYGGPHQNQNHYGEHQPQPNHYDYHHTSVANYNPAPYQGQQQPVEKQKQPNYPSIYNNNSKLNLFQPFYSGNIYEEANKTLESGGGDFSGPACSYTVANSANSPPGGALSTSSGYFSSNSSSPSTSSSVRSTSRCDSARSVESSCSSTDSGVDNNFPHTYGVGPATIPTSSSSQNNNNNNFVLVPVNSSSALPSYPPNVPVTSSPLTCMQPQPQQRLQNAPVGGASVGGANNNVMLNQQQPQQQQQMQPQHPPQPKQTRTDIAVPYGWRRLLVNNTIVYVSPSGAEICSREAARQYLITPGNCKCGLECPLHLDNVFCFDPKVTNRAWPLIPDPSDNTRLCNHKRKQQVPAALLASAPGGPRSPLHRNLIPNPAKDGQQCQQLVNVGGGRKKRRKVEAAAASASPYDRNLVSQILAQRERLENQQPLTAAAPTAPTPNPLELPQANGKPEKVPRVWDTSSMAPQQTPPHSLPAAPPPQMPPPHYTHHHPIPHLQPQGPSRISCHPSMMNPQQQQQQQQQHPTQNQQAPQQPPQYRGFPPPPPPPRPNYSQNLPFPTSQVEAQKQFQEHHNHMQSRGQPQRLPPPPYIYPPTSGGGFYPQQQQVPEKQWQYERETHQMAWDDLAKRKKLKAKKAKRETPPVEGHRPLPEMTPVGAAPSFMEDPNGYLAQQTALLNSTILRPQNFPPQPTPPPPPQAPNLAVPTVSSAAPSPITTSTSSTTTPIAPAPPPQQAAKAVPLPSNVTLPKGLNRTPPAASTCGNQAPAATESAPAAPDSASECHACTLIKEESQPAVTSTASPDPKGPIQGGTVSTSQEQQENKVEAPAVATSTPTKSPLEMVQSVVSSIQVPPKLATATPLTLTAPSGGTDLKLPPGHIFVSSNGQQLIFQGAAQKLAPSPQHTNANVLSALQQPMMQLVNTLPCNTPLLLHQPLQQTVTVEGPLLAALPAEDPKKRAKKRRPIQQAPAPQQIQQHTPQPQQQQILQSPLFMQNFQQPLLQTLTILPNKQPQFLLPQQGASQQQSPLGANPINLIQPLNLLNGTNFMSNLPSIQTLVVPSLQGMMMSTLPDGTLIPTDGGGGTVQLQLPNQFLMQSQFGQQNLISAPQMVIRAPAPQIVGQLISPQSQFLGFQQTLNGLTMMSHPKPPEQQQQFIMNVNGQPMIIPCSASVTPTTQSATLLHQNTTIVQQQTTTALVAAANNHAQQQPVQVNPLILKQFQDLTGPLLLQQKQSVSTQTAAQAAAALLPTMVQIPTSIYNSPPLEQMPPDTTTSSPISEPLKSLTPLNTECGVTSSEADPADHSTFSWVTKVDEITVESSTMLDKSRPLKRKLEEAPSNPLQQDRKCVVRQGDLVWGPFNGSPSWPGKLVSLSETLEGGGAPSKSKGWVRWFGSTLHSQIELNSLKSLSEGLEAHHTATKKLRKGRKMNQQLEKAIQEAMSELDKLTANKQQANKKKSLR
ncbi:methyl-CpG-binding domain protein 5-like isoform X2 [Neocloeon triangulifer]|uniref:methyl-CpG-binding domain protein 5-like isoform X2 n=1 Tax=Neocloeon triangulifer TaxID=2078957 RepID=UPI00286EBF22|nr:methyl-CpG-binding domain protein 5-like isoform X2 [Neocloeon triangulifer]